MTVRVFVDQATCIGSGTCIRIAKNLFALDSEGKAVVVVSSVTDEELARLAERSCPTGAIFVEEANEGSAAAQQSG
jgi:ferredoxin